MGHPVVIPMLSRGLTKNIQSSFREVANLLSDVFDDDDFVPTDIAAALLLLYSQHRENTAVSETERGYLLKLIHTGWPICFEKEIC